MTQNDNKGRLDGVWNVLSFLGLFGMVGMIVVVLMIFSNPASSVNPFPPPTLPAPIILPTSTATPPSLPPTWTPTISEEKLFEGTATPTAILATLLPDEGMTLETIESEVTDVASGYYQFELKSAPSAIQASLLKPELSGLDGECNWMGVGGQVMDVQGSPYTGVGIQLGGQQDGRTILLTSLTGTALQYGPAGYEFKISDEPYSTVHNFWLRLVDQSNLPLSERVYFDTYEGCDKNLIIIHFRQVHQ
ncbi:MAG: hypothetical protein JEZ00_02015 [Anaerolineaceae bacterium]|nr:hypothetical protein [Anaerolineaceae bacterium]